MKKFLGVLLTAGMILVLTPCVSAQDRAGQEEDWLVFHTENLTQAEKVWLLSHTDPAAININGVWEAKGWGKFVLNQPQDSREVTGKGGGYEITGIVSGKNLFLLMATKHGWAGGQVWYSAMLTLEGDDSLNGYYARTGFKGYLTDQTSGKPMQLKNLVRTAAAPALPPPQDAICVMPLIDARQDARPPLNLESLRPAVVQALEKHGYRTDTICSNGMQGSTPQTGSMRWILTVRVDNLLVTGAVLTGSIFDTQTGKEVWRHTAMPGYGGRYGNALAFNLTGTVSVDQLITSSFGALFSTLNNWEQNGK
jgi:hypothetical protein